MKKSEKYIIKIIIAVVVGFGPTIKSIFDNILIEPKNGELFYGKSEPTHPILGKSSNLIIGMPKTKNYFLGSLDAGGTISLGIFTTSAFI
jgi:hypothetical protein